MSLTEYEGTVPHHEGTSTTGPLLPSVLLGRVARRYSPTDAASRSKRFFEYDVICDVGSELRASSRMVFRHCIVASTFGGAADFTTHTLRVDTGAADLAANWDTGSRVLVLAINGSVYGGVVIGGIQHPGRGVDAPADNAETWQFNGVRVDVKDDGSAMLTYGGARNMNGSPQADVDETVVGSSVKLGSDGSVTFGTAGLQEYVRTDRRAGETQVVAQNAVSLQAGEVVQVQPTSAGTFKVGLATDALVKGTTYRGAEAVSNTAVVTGTTAAAGAWGVETGAWGALAALLVDPGFVALLALVAAAPGSLLAATVPALVAASTAAAAAAGSASASEAAAAAAVSAFEGGAPTYLSPRSSTD